MSAATTTTTDADAPIIIPVVEENVVEHDAVLHLYMDMNKEITKMCRARTNASYFVKKHMINLVGNVLFDGVIGAQSALRHHKEVLVREVGLYLDICFSRRRLTAVSPTTSSTPTPIATEVEYSAMSYRSVKLRHKYHTNEWFASAVRRCEKNERTWRTHLETTRARCHEYNEKIIELRTKLKTDCTELLLSFSTAPTPPPHQQLGAHLRACKESGNDFRTYTKTCSKLLRDQKVLKELQGNLQRVRRERKWYDDMILRANDNADKNNNNKRKPNRSFWQDAMQYWFADDIVAHVRGYVGEAFLTGIRHYCVVQHYAGSLTRVESTLHEWTIPQLRALACHLLFYTSLVNKSKHGTYPVSREDWVSTIMENVSFMRMHEHFEFVALLAFPPQTS